MLFSPNSRAVAHPVSKDFFFIAEELYAIILRISACGHVLAINVNEYTPSLRHPLLFVAVFVVLFVVSFRLPF